MTFRDMEDAGLALDEVLDFIGNYWPEHSVDVEGMGALLDAFGKVNAAAMAVWKLTSLLEHRGLEKTFGEARDGRDSE